MSGYLCRGGAKMGADLSIDIDFARPIRGASDRIKGEECILMIAFFFLK